MSWADWCGFIGSVFLLVAAVRDQAHRWWVAHLESRPDQPGLRRLRHKIKQLHEHARNTASRLDSVSLALGAALLALSYVL